MKELKAKVKLKTSDSEIEFSAIEYESDPVHYGNGIYITILKNGYSWQYIDARYIRYHGLQDFLTNYLIDFFGEEL